MKISYEYSGKKFILKPFNTDQEKQILLLELLGCDSPKEEALSICGIEDSVIESLSEKEKIAMLFKFRSISIGDEIPLGYKCKHCDTPNEVSLNIDGLVQDSNITNDKIVDQYKEVDEDNLNEFLSIDVDELDLDEFETILNEVESSITKFNFVRESACIKCREINYIDIEDDVISYMSEDTLMSLYQTYNDLTFFGKYTKQDIDSFLPFERSILIGLHNKTREELNK